MDEAGVRNGEFRVQNSETRVQRCGRGEENRQGRQDAERIVQSAEFREQKPEFRIEDADEARSEM